MLSEYKNPGLNTARGRHQKLHVADFVQSSSSLLHDCHPNSTDKNAESLFRSRRNSSNFVAQPATAVIACCTLVRVLSRPSAALDCRRVPVLHVQFQLCTQPCLRDLSKSTIVRETLSSRDATIMTWMSPVLTTSCSVTFLLLPCFKSKWGNTALAGKLTRTRPCAAVVDDSVGTTSVFPTRSVRVSRSSPVTSSPCTVEWHQDRPLLYNLHSVQTTKDMASRRQCQQIS